MSNIDSFKLGKDKKLLSKDEYSQVFATRNALYGKYFQVIYQKTTNSGRLGLAIAKKHHKLAVQRNTLKRIAREVFRLKAIDNYNIIVLSRFINNKNVKKSKKLFNKLDNTKIFLDLELLFSKLNKLKI